MENAKAELFQWFSKPLQENGQWLLSEDAEVCENAVELMNDAIDLVSAYAKEEQRVQSYEKLAFHFFAYHVLLPGTYALTLNLLAGGLPSCFRELRFMTEMIAKCYLADARYRDRPTYQGKLRALEGDGERKHRPVTPIMEDFDRELRSGGIATNLWRALSEETHARKYVGRVVKNVLERQNIHSYALVLPMAYTKDDLPDLIELNRYVEGFSEILGRTTQSG